MEPPQVQRSQAVSRSIRKWGTMASSAGRFDDRTFVGYARQHMFVTVFGVIIPLLVFVCFIGFPIVYTVYLSFFEWNGMSPQKKFVGFANYAYLFQDKYFYIA